MSTYLMQSILWCLAGTVVGALAGWLTAVLVAPFTRGDVARGTGRTAMTRLMGRLNRAEAAGPARSSGSHALRHTEDGD